MANDPNMGWAMTPIGTMSQSTMPAMTPQQVAQIQATTGAMQQPSPAIPPIQQPSAQQTAMMNGLFSQPGVMNPGSPVPGAIGPTSIGGAPLSYGPTSV